jgi:sigma-B regulation protein RsbU (phosphoserine phosphatase)
MRLADPAGRRREVIPPSEVLAHLEHEYPMERFEKFFSIVYLIVDVQDGTASCSSAGHPPPFWIRADGTLDSLDSRGPIIGQGGGLPYRDERRSLQPGDRILLCTDGILEHKNRQGELYGELRVQQALQRLAGLPIQATLDGVMEDVLAFGQQTPQDDMSLLGIEYKGKGE